ncbi:MAG: ATP/GTP-binding protein [Thermoanaerobaculales bacterium]
MVFFNYALRKLNAKIVYYGPGLCGKTTNLQWIHDHFEGGQRGKMISLATEGDRTIFFDLLPLEIGSIRGMEVTLQLYTVPGQVHYNSTRQLVLRGADGVVFVADSQRTMQTSNLDSFKNLQENLLLQGISLDGFPLALQFNKRDLRDVMPVEELNEQLNTYSMPIFEAIATDGVGVQETLEGIVKLVMRSLRQRYEPVVAAGAAPPSERSPGPRPPVGPPSSPGVAQPPPAPSPLAAPRPFADAPPAETAPASRQTSAPPAAIADPVESPGPPAFRAGEGEGAFEDHVNTAVYALGDKDKSGGVVGDAGFVDEATSATVAEPPHGADYSIDLEPPPAAPEFVDDEEPFARAQTDTGMEVPSVGEIVIGGTEEPAAPEPPPAPTEQPPADQVAPVERYEDRIEAPSPFAPQPKEPEIAAAPPVEPAAASAEWTSKELTEDVRQAFGAGENREALASLVADDERDDSAKPVPVKPVHQRPPTEPIMVGEGDPFGDLKDAAEPKSAGAIEPALRREIDVRAEDNQLHLRLQGTGAIVESGQVRALDIEVPVPGSWVGNRRVTLQLRLTLSPVPEDEDGESPEPS